MGKKFFARGFSLSIAAILIACCRGPARPGQEKITILFTNDLSGHVVPDRSGRGGLAGIAAKAGEIKSENPNTILLDAGDAPVGTAFTTLTRGQAMFQVMNAAGYEASVYGNHEFDLGQDQARQYQAIAEFPILACNIRDKDGGPFAQEYLILKTGSLRLGIIGIANPKTTNLVDKTAVADLKFLPAEREIRRLQKELADQADLLIVLSHQGIKEDMALAYHLSGVPLIIGGHSQIKIKGLRTVNNVAIAQAGENGYYLGRVDFLWDPAAKTAAGFRGRLIDIDHRVIPEPGVQKIITEEARALPSDLKRVIGKTRFTINKVFLGFWMAEVLKAEAQADFGIMNSGGVRSEIFRGEITPEDLFQVMPFNDKIAAFEISGKNLARIKTMRWFFFSRGPRIETGKTYRVASLDYLIRINDFPGARNEQFSDHLLRDKIIERIEKDGGISRFWSRQGASR